MMLKFGPAQRNSFAARAIVLASALQAVALGGCKEREYNDDGADEQAIVIKKRESRKKADEKLVQVLKALETNLKKAPARIDPFASKPEGLRLSEDGDSLELAEGNGMNPVQAAGEIGRFVSRGSASVCEVLKPHLKHLDRFKHMYYFVGTSAQLQAGVLVSKGIDAVWDLYNYQQGLFIFEGRGAGIAVGLNGSAYGGFALGNKPSVISAWSGLFTYVSVDFPIPTLAILLPILGGTATAFTGASNENGRIRPDSSIAGAAVAIGLTIGASISLRTLPVSNPTVGVANYVGYNDLIDKKFRFEKELWDKIRFSATGATIGQGSEEYDGQQFRYIQYGSTGNSNVQKASALSMSLLTSIGLPIIPQLVIPVALALGIWRDWEAQGNKIDCAV